MERKIKFRRAYFLDLSRTKFSHFSIWGVNVGVSVFNAPASDNFTKSWIDNQFTGLHDDNSVELYEGDIVVRPGILENTFVEWNDDFCGWQYSNGDTFQDECGSSKQIIGNVFEHPHLLVAGVTEIKC